jgi:hypothetical protein
MPIFQRFPELYREGHDLLLHVKLIEITGFLPFFCAHVTQM